MSNPPQSDNPGLQNQGQEELGVEKYKIKLLGGEIGKLYFRVDKDFNLGRLMKAFSNTTKVALERLNFLYHEQLVQMDDTPESLKMKVKDCSIVVTLREKKRKYIILVVGGDKLETMQFKVTAKNGLWKLMRTYCTRVSIPLASVCFTYNGRRITDDDTVGKLEMQDYDAIIVSKVKLS